MSVILADALHASSSREWMRSFSPRFTLGGIRNRHSILVQSLLLIDFFEHLKLFFYSHKRVGYRQFASARNPNDGAIIFSMLLRTKRTQCQHCSRSSAVCSMSLSAPAASRAGRFAKEFLHFTQLWGRTHLPRCVGDHESLLRKLERARARAMKATPLNDARKFLSSSLSSLFA